MRFFMNVPEKGRWDASQGHGPAQGLPRAGALQQAICCRTFCKCGVLRTKTQEAFDIVCLSELAFRAVVPPAKQRFPVCAVQAQTGNSYASGANLALLHLLNQGGELFGLLGEVGNGSGSLFHSFSREL